MFYIVPECFGAIISPFSEPAPNFFKAYSNKIGRNKHTYVVVALVQNFTGVGKNYVHKYYLITAKQ
jgi:hypothetical protein